MAEAFFKIAYTGKSTLYAWDEFRNDIVPWNDNRASTYNSPYVAKAVLDIIRGWYPGLADYFEVRGAHSAERI